MKLSKLVMALTLTTGILTAGSAAAQTDRDTSRNTVSEQQETRNHHQDRNGRKAFRNDNDDRKEHRDNHHERDEYYNRNNGQNRR